MISRVISIIAALFVFAGTAICAQEPQVGKPFPTFTAQKLNGHVFDLNAQRGKVVIVHFWATWCPECREEMPALDAFYRDMHNNGLEMIAISVDRENQREKTKEIMSHYVFGATMMNDVKTDGLNAPQAVPVTYIIDRNGNLSAALHPDEEKVMQENLERFITPLLKH